MKIDLSEYVELGLIYDAHERKNAYKSLIHPVNRDVVLLNMKDEPLIHLYSMDELMSYLAESHLVLFTSKIA